MNHERLSKLLFPILLWGSLLAVAPRFYAVGTNVVTKTYAFAAMRLGNRQTPYVAPSGERDWFKYSPLFGLAYRPFAALSPFTQAVSWAALNILFFWCGIRCWLTRKSSWVILFALLGASAELNISLLYQQVNALLIGIVLIALAAYRDQKFRTAGALLAIATNFKIVPVLFFLGLAPFGPTLFLGAFIFSSLLLLALPALWLSPSINWALHQTWLSILMKDAASPGLLDVQTVFSAWGLPSLGSFLRWFVLGGTLVLLWLRTRWNLKWEPWIALGSLCILLFSPRTESPTFVLMAPVYVLLCAYASTLPSSFRAALLGSLGLAFLTITFAYTDLAFFPAWPSHPPFSSKTIGSLQLWVVLAGMQVALSRRFSRP